MTRVGSPNWKPAVERAPCEAHVDLCHFCERFLFGRRFPMLNETALLGQP
jgi:hypothetical protein